MSIVPEPTCRPLRADAQRNRELILAAARTLFRERGLSVGLDEIARAAGVGVGTAYRRFPDKETLIDALFEVRLREILELGQRALQISDEWTGLTTFVEGCVAMQAGDRGFKQVVFGASRGEERVARARSEIVPIANELVRRAQAAGVLRADFEPTDVPLVQFMVSGLTDLTGHLAPELWRRYLGIVLDGLRTPAPTPLAVPALSLGEFEAVMWGSGR